MHVRGSRYLVMLVGIVLTLSGCIDSTITGRPEVTEYATTPPVPMGETDHGWPVESLSCSELSGQASIRRMVPFNSVTSLLICEHKGDQRSRYTLRSDGAHFQQVMEQLSAKDITPQPLGCPAILLHRHSWHLGVLATTPDGVYHVHIPYGICGAMQPDLRRALASAEIKVPGWTMVQ